MLWIMSASFITTVKVVFIIAMITCIFIINVRFSYIHTRVKSPVRENELSQVKSLLHTIEYKFPCYVEPLMCIVFVWKHFHLISFALGLVLKMLNRTAKWRNTNFDTT